VESRGHCIPVPMLGSCNQIPGNICRCRGNHEAASPRLLPPGLGGRRGYCNVTRTLLQRQGHLVRGVGQGGRVHRQQLRARQGLKGKCPDTCAAAVLLPHTHSLLSLISLAYLSVLCSLYLLPECAQDLPRICAALLAAPNETSCHIIKTLLWFRFFQVGLLEILGHMSGLCQVF
jgi:hypothetical protein